MSRSRRPQGSTISRAFLHRENRAACQKGHCASACAKRARTINTPYDCGIRLVRK